MAQPNAEVPFLIGEDFTERRNVTWRVEQAEGDLSDPLLEPEMPWDDGHPFLHGTVAHDPIDGLWKAWGTASPNAPFRTQLRRLGYLESEDGVRWRRPELDLSPIGDHPRTNVLLDLDTGGYSLCSSVLIDPEADATDRYEMFVLRQPGRPAGLEAAETVTGFTRGDGEAARASGLYRYFSGDGIRWRPSAGPLMTIEGDPLKSKSTNDNIFVYREADGTYVAYHKTVLRNFPGSLYIYETSAGACRILARRTSEDGVEWSEPEQVVLPDWRDTHDTQFMEISVTPAPGGYIGVLTVYKTANQTIELQFAASRDGRYWWRPDRRPCVAQPPVGDYGGGMMWGSHHAIVDGSFLHYYYTGLQGIHGDVLSTEEAEIAAAAGRPYKPTPNLHGEVITRLPNLISFQGALCRATWRRGRLWGLTTASGGRLEGTAVTSSSLRQGQTVSINATTVGDGEIMAELVGDNGRAVPGFDREACDPFLGDAGRAEIRWKGKAASPADGVHVRFVLRNARLYGFAFGD